jgi:hypothetical protein
LPPAFVGFFVVLLFDPEDGSDVFFRNIRISPIYMALQPIMFIDKAVRISNPIK